MEQELLDILAEVIQHVSLPGGQQHKEHLLTRLNALRKPAKAEKAESENKEEASGKPHK